MTRSSRSQRGTPRSIEPRAVITAVRAPNRRQVLAGALVSAGGALLSRPALAQGAQPRIVVVGGGFAGATAACSVKRSDQRLDVTLVEPNTVFTSCPFSNEVIAG